MPKKKKNLQLEESITPKVKTILEPEESITPKAKTILELEAEFSEYKKESETKLEVLSKRINMLMQQRDQIFSRQSNELLLLAERLP